jgi:hypothetical protein
MESPYMQKKFEFAQKMRGLGPKFRACVSEASKQPSKMIKPQTDHIVEAHVNINKMLAAVDSKFGGLPLNMADTDASLNIKYVVASNLMNVPNGGQLTAEFIEDVGGLYDYRATRVFMDSTLGHQKVILSGDAQIIGMGEKELFEQITKAFGWNRAGAVNEPAYTRNLAALLRQTHMGVNLATRIIKLMCYYFIAESHGSIKFNVNDLSRFQTIGYNYASIGNASVINDAAFTYCSDPHDAYVYMLHAVGMSKFPANVGHDNNNLYSGLEIQPDAMNLRIVVPDVHEVGLPNSVEMTANKFLCALNVLMVDYQIGDILAETLWAVSASMIAHNSYASISLPRVNSLALLSRPIWNPIFNVPTMIRKIDLANAIAIGYYSRSTLWAGVNTMLSWGIKGKHDYDAIATTTLLSTKSKRDRLYIARTLDQCLPNVWQSVCWLDGLRNMDRAWLNSVRSRPLLESYWVLEPDYIIHEQSSYSALCRGVLLRRSEDYSSSTGQRAGATGIALGILSGNVYSSTMSHVTGHGRNYDRRNFLSEGPITTRFENMYCETTIKLPNRGKYTRRYMVDLDVDEFETLADFDFDDAASDIDIELSENGGSSGVVEEVEVTTPIVVHIEPTASKVRWKPYEPTLKKRQESSDNISIAKSDYLERVINGGHIRVDQADLNNIRCAAMRHFTYGDTQDVKTDMANRVGIHKLFGGLDWKYSGGTAEIDTLVHTYKDPGWDRARDLLPSVMARTIEAGIGLVYGKIQQGLWPKSITVKHKILDLWLYSTNLKKLPEFGDDQHDDYILALEALEKVLKNCPSDNRIHHWWRSLMRENSWDRYIP